MTIRGTRNDDDLSGTTGDDVFNMAQGGDDTVSGGRGDDTFLFGKWLTAADHIDGGNGIDTLVVAGDYTGANALVFAADTVTKLEAIQFRAGFSYDVTLARLTGVLDRSFTADAHALGAGESLTLDASAALVDMTFIGGAGNDVLTGSIYVNVFDLSRGGSDIATGNSHVDTFRMGATLDATDRIDGGGESDTIELKGRYGDPGTPVVLADDTFQNIEVVKLTGNFDYALKFADGNLAASGTLRVDASALGASRNLHIDASAETDGAYIMLAGAGDNTLIGGAGNDTFLFQGNFDSRDFVDGGAGSDTLSLGQAVGVVVDGSSIVNVERLAFSGTSDVTVTGAIHDFHLDGTTTASLTADVSGASFDFFYFDGGAGDDAVHFGAGLSTYSFVDGGKGVDTVAFDAPSQTLDLGVFYTSIEKIVFEGATSTYDVTLDTNFDPTEQTLAVDASALSDASSSLHLDATHQGGTFLHIVGGAGDDELATGQGFDTIDGGAGDDIIRGGFEGDTLTGGSGSDTFVYPNGSDSYAHFERYDHITDFDAAADFLKMPFAVTYDGETSGSVTRPATDLAQIVNPLMTVDGAVLVNVTGGKLAGHLLLAIDGDHDGQYTTDILIDVTGMANAASFGSADFVT